MSTATPLTSITLETLLDKLDDRIDKKITHRLKPYATKKFVKNEISKQTELFIKSFNQLIKRMDKRFDQVDLRFKQVNKRFKKIDKKFEQVSTKTEALEYKVELMDELKIIREEQGANSSIDIRQNKEIENHTERLVTVEEHLNLAVA